MGQSTRPLLKSDIIKIDMPQPPLEASMRRICADRPINWVTFHLTRSIVSVHFPVALWTT
jgi:hypothetical protein